MSEKMKIYLLYIISGIIVSLISGLYTQDLTNGIGTVVTGYGLPLDWLEKTTIVVPGNPSYYSLSSYGLRLLADIVFWSTIAWIAHALYERLKR